MFRPFRHLEMTSSCASLSSSLWFTDRFECFWLKSDVLCVLQQDWVDWDRLSFRRLFGQTFLFCLNLDDISHLFFLFLFLFTLIIHKNSLSKWNIPPRNPISPVCSKTDLALRAHFGCNRCYHTFISDQCPSRLCLSESSILNVSLTHWIHWWAWVRHRPLFRGIHLHLYCRFLPLQHYIIAQSFRSLTVAQNIVGSACFSFWLTCTCVFKLSPCSWSMTCLWVLQILTLLTRPYLCFDL